MVTDWLHALHNNFTEQLPWELLSIGRAKERASPNGVQHVHAMKSGMWQRPLLHTAGGAGAGEATSKYDLVANLCHDGKAGEGTYKIHIHRKKEELWCGSPSCSGHSQFV